MVQGVAIETAGASCVLPWELRPDGTRPSRAPNLLAVLRGETGYVNPSTVKTARGEGKHPTAA